MKRAGTPIEPPAGRWPPAHKNVANYKFSDCEAIESEVRLTPPDIVDKLCKGERLPPVSGNPIFAEELLEIAKRLNRTHLITIEKGDP
jgi:hypothetical protein